MTTPEPEGLSPRQRWHLIALLIVAPASAILGFLLVVTPNGGMERVFSSRTERGGDRVRDESSRADGGSDGGMVGDGQPVMTASASSDDTLFHGIHVRPTLPIKVGDPFYFRCWNADSETPHEGESCGRIKHLERAMSARMGDVLRCYERLDRQKNTGHLSLAVEVDFAGVVDGEDGGFTIWSGRSTTIEDHESFITCLRERLSEPNLSRMRHKRQRYTIFFPIDFVSENESARQVEVVLDRVRLRREPVKGSIRAVLNQGEPISVFEVRDGWVRAKTLDGREGWLFAEGITVPDP